MSTVFKDCEGREWSLKVTVRSIQAVRAARDLDLASFDEGTMDRLATDPVLLVDVLWLLCEKQARERGVGEEQFAEAMFGDTIERAVDAMVESIAAFFPERKSCLLRNVTAKVNAVRAKAERLALAKLDDPTVMERMDAALERRMTAEFERILTQLDSPTN